MRSDLTRYVALPELLAARRELPGGSWTAERSSDGVYVAIRSTTEITRLRVLHDLQPAPMADVEFVAASLNDFDTLLGCLQGESSIDRTQLSHIRRRVAAATPGPWVCYLESGGGLGGSNVITTPGLDADLYLLVDGRSAPDAIWAFVALAREELPSMLAAADPLSAGG
jgi:hypothetical protein